MLTRKKLIALGVILAATSFAISIDSRTGWALDYDLKASGIWAEPAPLVCDLPPVIVPLRMLVPKDRYPLPGPSKAPQSLELGTCIPASCVA